MFNAFFFNLLKIVIPVGIVLVLIYFIFIRVREEEVLDENQENIDDIN